MKIYLDNLDSITKTKYKEFQDKVEKLLAEYQTTDSDRFKKVKNKLKVTKRFEPRRTQRSHEARKGS